MTNALTISQAANFLQASVFKASNDAGWWTEKDGTPLQKNRYVFAAKLMLCVSELAEACEGDRKGKMDDHLPHRPAAEVELADAIIRCLDLGAAYGFDLGGAIEEKMAYNLHRADHQLAARAAPNGKAY